MRPDRTMQPKTPAHRPTTPATAITESFTRSVSQLKAIALNPVATPTTRAEPTIIASSWGCQRSKSDDKDTRRRGIGESAAGEGDKVFRLRATACSV